MNFISLEFMIFLPVVSCVFYLLNAKYRLAWIVLCSCFFYVSYIPKYILVLALLISIDFVLGSYIQNNTGTKKKFYLFLSLFSNLGILFYYKYLSPSGSFFPMGLSFHTFQSMSYSIEVYLGRYKAETNLLRYSCYVMFFPQLVAGPIERPQGLLPQLSFSNEFQWSRVQSGINLLLFGLVKKMIVADNLSPFINSIYQDLSAAAPAQVAFATFIFGLQIYFDFSGYTDIARGSARILQIDLSDNFDRPFFATSLMEYWRKWHMSLFSWFRDYVFTPFVLSFRKSSLSPYVGLFLVFIVSGVWHGANQNFLLWACWHAFFMILWTFAAKKVETKFASVKFKNIFAQTLGWLVTMLIVTLSWAFFRTKDLGSAKLVFEKFYELLNNSDSLSLHLSLTPIVILALGFAICLIALEKLEQYQKLSHKVLNWPIYIQLPFYYLVVFSLAQFGVKDGIQFIYFQF